MELNTHKVCMPLHIYKASRALWQYQDKIRSTIDVYGDLFDIFQRLYKEVEIKANLCDYFIKKCDKCVIYKYRVTKEILLSFYIKKIKEAYNLDCPYSYEGIVEQLNSINIDYLQELDGLILNIYKDLIKLKNDYLGMIYNKDREIEINSMNDVIIPYNDYEEFEKMEDSVNDLITKCSDIFEIIKYCKTDDFRYRIFNSYFEENLLYSCKTFMCQDYYSIH